MRAEPASLRIVHGVAAALIAFVVVTALALAGAQLYFERQPLPPAGSVLWGATFSQKMSARLDLDWRANYEAVVTDLRPSRLRLIAYWDLIEPRQGELRFDDLDWQVKKAEDAGIPIVLAVGRKVPRWPEYHLPKWVRRLPPRAQRQALLTYLRTVVERYRGRKGLVYWQVENEPFLDFGVGGKPDAELFGREVKLVRELDPTHPILVTDGGEWGTWWRTAPFGDVLGTTLYRRVYDRQAGPVEVPLPPEYYRLKRWGTGLLDGRRDERIICAELAAEPWGRQSLAMTSWGEQATLFPGSAFDDTVRYARRAGYDEYYFWGVEWWYFRKIHGDASYWDRGKAVIRSGRGG